MGTSAKIIPLKKVIKTYRQAHPKQVRNVDGIKYFNNQQIKYLRRTVRDRAELDRSKNNTTGIKEWMVIDLLTSTGIRVDEASKIRCGDIRAGYAESALFIHQGKGSRSRTVQIPESLKKHLKQFLAWKKHIGEPKGEDDCLFLGQRGPWTRQAIQQIVKKYLKQIGLYKNGKSVHSIRHSYAVELYRKERDLRAVQKQLGHKSIQTTQIYADVTEQDIQGQIKGLWS